MIPCMLFGKLQLVGCASSVLLLSTPCLKPSTLCMLLVTTVLTVNGSTRSMSSRPAVVCHTCHYCKTIDIPRSAFVLPSRSPASSCLCLLAAEEREDSIPERMQQATQAAADFTPASVPPSDQPLPDQPAAQPAASASQSDSPSMLHTPDDSSRPNPQEAPSGPVQSANQEDQEEQGTSASGLVREVDGRGRKPTVNTRGMQGSVAESAASSNARQQSSASVASTRPGSASTAASPVGEHVTLLLVRNEYQNLQGSHAMLVLCAQSCKSMHTAGIVCMTKHTLQVLHLSLADLLGTRPCQTCYLALRLTMSQVWCRHDTAEHPSWEFFCL